MSGWRGTSYRGWRRVSVWCRTDLPVIAPANVKRGPAPFRRRAPGVAGSLPPTGPRTGLSCPRHPHELRTTLGSHIRDRKPPSNRSGVRYPPGLVAPRQAIRWRATLPFSVVPYLACTARATVPEPLPLIGSSAPDRYCCSHCRLSDSGSCELLSSVMRLCSRYCVCRPSLASPAEPSTTGPGRRGRTAPNSRVVRPLPR